MPSNLHTCIPPDIIIFHLIPLLKVLKGFVIIVDSSGNGGVWENTNDFLQAKVKLNGQLI